MPAGHTLFGTLTLPAGAGQYPAVVLISGSGAQDRDETIPIVPGYRPFRVIADHLARRGVAVFRYDDRGTAKSTGNHATATSAGFADDAEAAWRVLRARREIHPHRVGLMGHSEGGLIAAMVTARNPRIAFVVSMAGPGAGHPRTHPQRAVGSAAGADPGTGPPAIRRAVRRAAGEAAPA